MEREEKEGRNQGSKQGKKAGMMIEKVNMAKKYIQNTKLRLKYFF